MGPRLGRTSRALAERLGAAVDYLEERLNVAPDVDEVARRAGFSRWHFMRIFQATTGYPVVEYVRLRRLAGAASALSEGRPPRVVAADWGYASQATFTRAFSRAFGVSPAAFARRARHDNTLPDVLPRLDPRIPFPIEPPALPRRVARPAVRLVGIGARAPVRRYEHLADLAALWTDWFANERWCQIRGTTGREDTIGLSRMHAGGEVEHVLGVEVEQGVGAPRGYRTVEVPGRTCAMFSGDGPPMQTVQRLILAAYVHWLPSDGVQRRFAGWDLTVYRRDPALPPGSCHCELWIPLAGAASADPRLFAG